MPTTLFMLMSMAIVACMNAGGSGGSSYRVPPPWGPEMAARYPFQTYARSTQEGNALQSSYNYEEVPRNWHARWPRKPSLPEA